MRTLGEDGITKAINGLTSIEEISRVCEGQVDLKAATVAKVEPFVKTGMPEIKIAPAKIDVKTSDFEDYQKG